METLAVVAYHQPLTRTEIENIRGVSADSVIATLVDRRFLMESGRKDVAGRPIPARRKGNRVGCACAESRDIGAYETCPHGCAYCYAVTSRTTARHHLTRRHDPDGEFLLPP